MRREKEQAVEAMSKTTRFATRFLPTGINQLASDQTAPPYDPPYTPATSN